MSTFQSVRLSVSHGPDLQFEGRALGEYSTQRKDGGKTRWTELRLWETKGGSLIAESVGRSTAEREGDIREAKEIGQVIGARPRLVGLEEDAVSNAMAVWGWSSAAKAFARQLGWDVVRRVD